MTKFVTEYIPFMIQFSFSFASPIFVYLIKKYVGNTNLMHTEITCTFQYKYIYVTCNTKNYEAYSERIL